MANIRFYSSDHGMGHVGRDIAIIKELIKIPGTRVFARNLTGNKLITNSFSKNVSVTPKQNDFGVINKNHGFATDKEKTYEKLKEWKLSWDDFIVEEKRFCKGHEIDYIVSDISPQPFIVANELKIPSVAMSNFTWHCIYSQLFGKNDPIVKELANTYRLANKAIIIPFEQENMPFKSSQKSGLVCKKTEKTREEVRKMLNVTEDDFLIFVSMGFSMENLPKFSKMKIDKKIKIISSFIPGAIKIPDNFYNSQDVIAASDMVACKSGYTTAAEAISGRVPMILTARDNFVDDETVCKGVEKMGVGKRISNENFLSFEYLKDCMEFSRRAKKAYETLPKRFASLQNEEVAKTILSY